MIQITPQMRILVAVEPVDFRKGIDGLAALCRQVLASSSPRNVAALNRHQFVVPNGEDDFGTLSNFARDKCAGQLRFNVAL